ncbi:MAG: J domain-containing protein [Eubacteriales bacterium]|nr:J domain-containing protein [Eubacteriales bacterium]
MTRKEALDYLNLAENATPEEIRERYLELIEEYNPEQYTDPGMIQLSQRYTDDVNAAYDALTSDRFTGAKTIGDKQSEPGKQYGQGAKRSAEANQTFWQNRQNSWTSWNKNRRSQSDPCMDPCLCLCTALLCPRCACCIPFV